MHRTFGLVTPILSLLFVVGCCCGGTGQSGSWEKDFEELMAETAEEVEVAETVEPAGKEPKGGPRSPCDRYSKCCSDYIEALGRLPDYPAESIEAAKEGCEAMELLKDLPGGDESCQTALDGLQQGVVAMEAYPGWKTPPSCK